MASDAQAWPQPEAPAAPDSVEMPRPTAAPLVLALGITLLAAGVALGTGFLVVGAVVVVAGLSLWIVQLLPGRGHVHESLVEPARPRPVTARAGRRGASAAGHARLPPASAAGRPSRSPPASRAASSAALVMPVPALLWGLLSGHGLWYPVNLLAGMVLPGVGRMTVPELEQFHASLLVVALVIHVVMSVVFGLIYGVLLPTLPAVPRPIAWGGLLMPLLWTGVSYVADAGRQPGAAGRVSWPWFIALAVRLRHHDAGRGPGGQTSSAGRSPELAGGLVGGAAMAAARRPVGGGQRPRLLVSGQPAGRDGPARPGQPGRRRSWGSFHAGLVRSRPSPSTPSCPSASGSCSPCCCPGCRPSRGRSPGAAWSCRCSGPGPAYGLMGVVNPVLQERVDWAWFIVSQFVFGVAAAVVVLRSEMVHIPPAGPRPGPGGRLRGRRRGRSVVKQPRARDGWRLLTLLARPDGRLRPSRPAQGRGPPGAGGPGHRFRRPVRPALRRLPRGRRQARPGAAAERPALPRHRPRRGAAASHHRGAGRHAAQKSPMPAFAAARGGPLTDAQVKVLAEGIKKRWGPAASGETLPPYLEPGRRPGAGNRGRGAHACSPAPAPAATASQGQGGEDGERQVGAINDPAFLALISDQALRRYVDHRPARSRDAGLRRQGRPAAGFPPADLGGDRRPGGALASWRQGGPASGQ